MTEKRHISAHNRRLFTSVIGRDLYAISPQCNSAEQSKPYGAEASGPVNSKWDGKAPIEKKTEKKKKNKKKREEKGEPGEFWSQVLAAFLPSCSKFPQGFECLEWTFDCSILQDAAKCSVLCLGTTGIGRFNLCVSHSTLQRLSHSAL